MLAPNPHNRQPWIAELPEAAPETVVLRCDLDRRLPVTDPFDRQITIGLGAFVELFRLAAMQEGRAVTTLPFPAGEPQLRVDARPVAVLRLGAPGSARPDPLFAHAAARRSTKRPFDMARPVGPEAFQALALTVAAPVRFGGTAQPDRVAAIRDVAWRSWQIEAATEAAHLESVNLMRLGRSAVAANPDGISIWGPGIKELVAAGRITRDSMMPGGAGYQVMIDRYTPMLAAPPACLWLTTPGNGRAEQLAAGRDWLRVNLAATAAGLALHPISRRCRNSRRSPAHMARCTRCSRRRGTGYRCWAGSAMLARCRRPHAGAPRPGFVPPDPPIFAVLNEVSIIEHLARNRLERVLPEGLRASHFVVLNHLVRLGDGRSPARIARAVQVEPPTMTNTIQRLEARGFVRVGPDPRDGRGKLVFLTEAGRAARGAAVAAATSAIAPLAADIAPAELEAALPLLRRLRAALDAARHADGPWEAQASPGHRASLLSAAHAVPLPHGSRAAS